MRKLSILLILVIVISSLSIPASASFDDADDASDGTATLASVDGDWEYTYDSSWGVDILAYNGSDTDVVIPSELGGHPVVVVGSMNSFDDPSIFSNPESITSVTIPDSVRFIALNAFANCTSLQSLEIPNISLIYRSAFQGCTSLQTINIKSITSPASIDDFLAILYGNAFIDPSAFVNCPALESINVLTENQYYKSEDGILYNSDMTKLIYYPEGKLPEEYVMPDTVESIYSVNYSIGNNNLKAIRLSSSFNTDITFPNCDGLENIEVDEGNGSYISIDGVLFDKSGDKIVAYPVGKTDTEYSIPDGTKAVPASVFTAANNLTKLFVPGSVTSIDPNAFTGNNSVTDIEVDESSESYSSIDGVLYNKDKTTLIRFPEARQENEFIVPEGVLGIGDYAFYYTSLSNIYLPDGLISIGNYSFAYSALTGIKVPDTVSSIGKYAFRNCSDLTEAVLSSGMSAIDTYTFYSCTGMTAVTIPKSITEIGKNAFGGCTSLEDVYYTGTQTEWKSVNTNGDTHVIKATMHYASDPTPSPSSEPTATPVPTATPEPVLAGEWTIRTFDGQTVILKEGEGTTANTDFIVIAAKYKDDVLLDVVYDSFKTLGTTAANNYATLSREMIPEEDEYVKIMLWESIDTCRPLGEAFYYYKVPAFPGAEGSGKYTN